MLDVIEDDAVDIVVGAALLVVVVALIVAHQDELCW